MTVVLRTSADDSNIESVVGGLIRAWNNGDAMKFAGFFDEDADLVNIHGMHLHGRQSIAGLYDMLFRSIFQASTTQGVITGKRHLNKNIALLHVRVALHNPKGKMSGSHDALTSLVMVRHGSQWRVSAMHNTKVSTADQ